MTKPDFVPLPASAEGIGPLDLPHTALRHGKFEQGLPGGDKGPPGGEQQENFGQQVKTFVHDYLADYGTGQGLGHELSQWIQDHHQADNVPPPLAGFEGATINYFYTYSYGGLASYFDQDVTSGVDAVFSDPSYPVGYMYLSGNSVVIYFTQTASFDGSDRFTLSDPYNEVPDITGVTLAEGHTGLFSQDNIKFDPANPNQVTVDMSGTVFFSGYRIVLDFSFATSSEAAPALSHESESAQFQGGGPHDTGWLLA